MASPLRAYDLFVKTAEDARVRTTSGGMITLVSILVMIVLTFSEWKEYTSTEYKPQLVVDTLRGEDMSIYINISFPTIPCGMISLDIIDVTGDVRTGLTDNLLKTRLDAQGNPTSVETVAEEAARIAQLEKDVEPLPENYCGPCYGTESGEGDCCNTCQEVIDRYNQRKWQFEDGSEFEQCVREKYPEKTRFANTGGCNMAGNILVKKVKGNFHFVPGETSVYSGQHAHDLSQYAKHKGEYTVSHIIHALHFGPEVNPDIVGSQMILNPLDGAIAQADDPFTAYSYFIKVISTEFTPLKGNPISTNQYAVTAHERGLEGGRDHDHPNTYHMRGGSPGVFFVYDISAMRVVHAEQRKKTFLGFLSSACASIGGVLAVAATADRLIFEGRRRLGSKKDV
ncbi:hypothetical protein CANCADRAFT_141066 [Tortispora caseinolytica NRRL Y-17796]|uniref:Endoplasmic reticulum-Golgi intermediate compartment protein n=1 Tax=Tortispora caseinolytica NRRL Y-17796 TaxID=767744 RepID=A0A1E4TCS3_9ASCO|nr:hypothetical protein CANCADRAFT_141066 [Tortispora caseinolytica NRRL Y-17796]